MLILPGEESETTAYETSKLYVKKEQRDDSTAYASTNGSLNPDIEVELDTFMMNESFISHEQSNYQDEEVHEEKETSFNDVAVLCKEKRWSDLSKLFNTSDMRGRETETLLREAMEGGATAEIIWSLIYIQQMKEFHPVKETIKFEEYEFMEGFVFKLRSFIFPRESQVAEKSKLSMRATVRLLALLSRVEIEEVMLHSEKAWETFSFLFMPDDKLCDRYVVSSNTEEIPLEEIEFLLDNEDLDSDDRYAALDTRKIGVGIQKYFTACLGMDTSYNSLKPPLNIITNQLTFDRVDETQKEQEIMPFHKDVNDDESVNGISLERYCVNESDNIEKLDGKQLFCYGFTNTHSNQRVHNMANEITHNYQQNEICDDEQEKAEIMIISSLSYQESFDDYGDDEYDGANYEFIRSNRGLMIPDEYNIESPYYSETEIETVYTSDDDESDTSSVSTSLYTILFSIVVGSDHTKN